MGHPQRHGHPPTPSSNQPSLVQRLLELPGNLFAVLQCESQGYDQQEGGDVKDIWGKVGRSGCCLQQLLQSLSWSRLAEALLQFPVVTYCSLPDTDDAEERGEEKPLAVPWQGAPEPVKYK